MPLKRADKKVGLLLCLCCLNEARCCSAPGPQQRTRGRVSVSGAHYSCRPSGSAACNMPAQPQISDMYGSHCRLLRSYKTPDFSHRLGRCCHPAPRRDREADCVARSSVAARIASTSRASCCRLCSWACVLAKASFDSRLRSCFKFVY